LRLLAMLEEQIAALNTAVERAAGESAPARLLMTQPGVGPVTALAFVVTIGDAARFKRGKQVASYLGLIPSERSSGNSRRLGAITKQGNVFLRTLLVEAAPSAVRHDETFRKEYRHRCHSKPKGVAKVAAARKLAVKLFWMLRSQQPQPVHAEGSPSHSLVGAS
jgi:transposase